MAGGDYGRGFEDLGARIASALVLGPAAAASAVTGGPWIAGAAGAAAVAMSYEWGRMSEPKSVGPAFAFSLIGVLGAIMLASRGRPEWALAWLVLIGALSALRRPHWTGRAETSLGVLYLGAPCVALLWVRAHPGHGLEATLALFGIIWAADSAAYFGGRLFGGPKLLPQISPNKTWSGLALGVSAGGGVAAVCASVFDGPVGLWLGVGVALALIGLGGDVLESLLKRRFGVKDASRLIPGHGGVLDRIDGLMAASVAAAVGFHLAPRAVSALFGAGHS